MATVAHRYEPSPLSVEKAAAKKAEAERRAEAARRKELARRTERRSANRGAAGLRREKTALERVKRLLARNGGRCKTGRADRARASPETSEFSADGHAFSLYVGAECVGSSLAEHQRPAGDGRTASCDDDANFGRTR